VTQKTKTTSSIRTMNSVLSTLLVFEQVAARQPIGVSDLSRATGIPKSSVQRCLVTLQQAGWLRIVDAQQARWGLTLKALTLGLRGAGEQDLRELAAPTMKRLAATTDETVHLCLRDGDEWILIAREDSTQVLRVFFEIGMRVPLRASTAGVAIMAELEDDEIDELLAEELSEFAGSALPSTAELRAEIARTAARGYALNMSAWYRPHVASIGAAVRNPAGRPIAALVLTIPESRFDESQQEKLAELTITAADEISRALASA
jgi:IclR family acetate operon transcriptional repressor